MVKPKMSHTRHASKFNSVQHVMNSTRSGYFRCMTVLQVLLAILFPPLAVLDRGCGSILIVLLLTACGWVPGVIAALVILNKDS